MSVCVSCPSCHRPLRVLNEPFQQWTQAYLEAVRDEHAPGCPFIQELQGIIDDACGEAEEGNPL